MSSLIGLIRSDAKFMDELDRITTERKKLEVLKRHKLGANAAAISVAGFRTGMNDLILHHRRRP